MQIVPGHCRIGVPDNLLDKVERHVVCGAERDECVTQTVKSRLRSGSGSVMKIYCCHDSGLPEDFFDSRSDDRWF